MVLFVQYNGVIHKKNHIYQHRIILYIFRCSEDATVIIWDINTGSISYKFEHHNDKIYSISWSITGNYISTGSLDGITYIWNTNSGEIIRGYKDAGVFETQWSPMSHKIASCHCNGNITIMDEVKNKN